MTGDVIAAAFGEDFDLYTGFAELTAQIYCEACGASRPRITFKNPNERHFGPYSMEESITAHLERGAFAQARDGEEPKRRYRGNYRKFGRR